MKDDQVLDALKGVCDPELGIGIVDLGLVLRATQMPHRIDVALMPTSPSCPLGELLVEETREALHARFPHVTAIEVELVSSPAWSPDRMSADARKRFG